MIRYFRFLAFPALVAGLASAVPADKLTTQQLVAKLTASIENLQTLRCNVRAQERIGSNVQQAQTSMKMVFKPYKVYLRNQKGIEVLYVTGQNDGDAWVYPNSFPYVTVSLDPLGALMRKTQHHSVLDAGYGTIADMLRGSTLRQDHTYEKSFRYSGDTTLQGRPGYILRSDYPQFRYVSYKPTKPETVTAIAERFGCGEYRILERNDLAPGATVAAGRALQVPNAYGRRVIIVVDQKLMLPLVIQVHDDKGLFEKFEFSNIVPNQPIPSQEFTKDFKGYKL